jgi:hypothetical protein
VKHALHRGKVRVRGLFRTTCSITCAVLAVNLRRIHRYENDQQRGKLTSRRAKRDGLFAFSLPFRACYRSLYLALALFRTCFSC